MGNPVSSPLGSLPWGETYRKIARILPDSQGHYAEIGLFLCMECWELLQKASQDKPDDSEGENSDTRHPSPAGNELGIPEMQDLERFQVLENPNKENSILIHCKGNPISSQNFEKILNIWNSLEPESEFSNSLTSQGTSLLAILKVLTKTGSSREALRFEIDSDQRLCLSLTLDTLNYQSNPSRTLLPYLTRIESLPSPSPFLQELEGDLSSNEISLSTIAKKIEQNPSFALEIMKLANSAFFSRTKPADSIEKALLVLGIKGLYQLLQIAKYKELGKINRRSFIQIWDHSLETAFFSRRIAEMHEPGLGSIAYLGGLLHDLGKLVLSSEMELLPILLNRNFQNHIVYSDYIEEILLGISHTILGGILGRKWKFSSEIQACVEYHHRPWSAEETQKRLASIVYLANVTASDRELSLDYEVLNKSIIAGLGIHSRDDFSILRAMLKKEYNERKDES
jgi:HD-like signal output (HDOD) protein